MEIQIEHTKCRLYFILPMFLVSLYNWYTCSLYDPVNTSFFTSYYQNCMLMLFYLGWDAYHMMYNPLLFRMYLMVHHILSFVTYSIFINICPLQMSHLLIMQCILLMDNLLINHQQLLNMYRTLCILLIRIPIWNWMWLYYFPTYILPNFQVYVYLSVIGKIMPLVTLYDIVILWKICKYVKYILQLKHDVQHVKNI